MLSESTLNLGDAPPTAPHRSRGMYIAITKKQDEGMPSRCVSGQFVLQQAPRSELYWDGWDAPWEVSSPNRSCPPPSLTTTTLRSFQNLFPQYLLMYILQFITCVMLRLYLSLMN